MAENVKNELLFDKDSFTDEITNSAVAKACYDYFTHNIQNFRDSMNDAGMDYVEQSKLINQVWKNLITSSERVGYTNAHMDSIKDYIK